ncbi:MAG: DEAD/DEAH box helicase [Kineosporiaceae bacterium]
MTTSSTTPARGSGPRRRSGGRTGGRPRTATRAPAPRAPRPSELDLALDAAAAADQPTPASFRGFGLSEDLVVTLERRGIRVPSPIQARTLPDALAGRDVLGRARTGSGKTLAFGVPMLALLARGPRARATRPTGLVLVPTRELAEQVRNALAPLAQTLGLAVAAVYGGASIPRQVDALTRGADVVVATPGRLEDLVARGSCHLGEVRVAVLDEADFMADLGFLPAVTRILDQVPGGGQKLLFSATLDRGVDALVRRYLSDPAVHAVASAETPVDSMDHLAFEVTHDDKTDVAAEVAARHGRTLFFVRTKHGADRLTKRLARNGVSAAAIHGNRSQPQRQRALDDFAAGRVPVLVATDVAARGIHVDDVDLVVHYDPPADHKDYLHRSGRTARAGARGTVLSILLPDERRDAERMYRHLSTGTSVVAVAPGTEAVRALASSGTPITVVERPAPRPEPDRHAGSRPRGGYGRDGRTRGGVPGRRPGNRRGARARG